MSELQDELRRWTDEAFGLEFSADVHVARLERLLRQTLYQNATSPVVDSLRLSEPIIHHGSNSFTAAILAALRDERRNDGD